MAKGSKAAKGKKGSKRSSKKAYKKKKKTTRKKTLAPILRPTPSDRTAAEAAELLGLSDAASVRKLLSRGKIKGRLVCRQQWIKLSEIDKYNGNRLPVGRPMD